MKKQTGDKKKRLKFPDRLKIKARYQPTYLRNHGPTTSEASTEAATICIEKQHPTSPDHTLLRESHLYPQTIPALPISPVNGMLVQLSFLLDTSYF